MSEDAHVHPFAACLSHSASIPTQFSITCLLLVPTRLRFPSSPNSSLHPQPLRRPHSRLPSLSLLYDPFHSDTDSLVQTTRTFPFISIMDWSCFSNKRTISPWDEFYDSPRMWNDYSQQDFFFSIPDSLPFGYFMKLKCDSGSKCAS